MDDHEERLKRLLARAVYDNIRETTGHAPAPRIYVNAWRALAIFVSLLWVVSVGLPLLFLRGTS